MTEDLRIRLQQLEKIVPTNWLDPLLTGPRAVVGKPPYNCQDVERLLSAIRKQLADELAALIAALPQHEGWQPIESAPKNGTEIVAWNGRMSLVMAWRKLRHVGGFFDAKGIQLRHLKAAPPTHWMPLPAAPSPDRSGGRKEKETKTSSRAWTDKG